MGVFDYFHEVKLKILRMCSLHTSATTIASSTLFMVEVEAVHILIAS